MKKIISILLAVIMAFSMMPLTALADEVEISSDSIFETDFETEDISIPTKPLDYSAYDASVKFVEELDPTPYTEESFKALKDSIVPKNTLTTQAKIDRATANINTARTNLVKKSIAVNFLVVDSKDNLVQKKLTFAYGEEAELEVTETEEVATKWLLSTDEADTKLDVVGNSYSFVAKENVTVTAFTDVKAEDVEQVKVVKFLAINGKVVDIVYTADVDSVEMPEGPQVPFYTFLEWEKLDDLTFQAKYEFNPLCDGENHTFYLETINPGCETVGYLIFRCECGEAYSTEYVRPTGHRYEDGEEYCLNGCGKYNPNIEDESQSPETPSVQPEEPTTKPTEPEKNIEYGFDEGGYNNVVIMP